LGNSHAFSGEHGFFNTLLVRQNATEGPKCRVPSFASLPPIRRCEEQSDEAITAFPLHAPRDCFVASLLAMTRREAALASDLDGNPRGVPGGNRGGTHRHERRKKVKEVLDPPPRLPL